VVAQQVHNPAEAEQALMAEQVIHTQAEAVVEQVDQANHHVVTVNVVMAAQDA
jgi:hypothetical protein